MKRANVAEIKNRLSYYLHQVRRGETVLVMDRKTPVARIVPIALPAKMAREDGDAWLRALEEKGILVLGARQGVSEIIQKAPPGRRPVGAVKTLIEDRNRR